MVDEIGVPGYDRSDRLTRADRRKIGEPRKAADLARGDGEPEVEVASELRELIARVRRAETVRKHRVHQVLEKLQRGELVTSETVREAAERLLREGV